ncbi:MAG: GntR family transcriptional regulator [Chloroflexi bacterium]|nr:GntR family transcriptional regulator [Chloroflexota bacterium]
MFDQDLSAILSLPDKRSLADEVTDSIREAILSGRLSPGERLREESLAKTLRVSRGPVRTAIQQLEREGLVRVRRNYGTFVARLSRQDLDEVYSLRLAIERLAVQMTCQISDGSRLNATRAVIARMASYNTNTISELEAAELDLQFHDAIYRATAHHRLIDVWSALRPQIHILLLTRNVVDSDFRVGLIEGHQLILDAITQRDEVLAIELTEAHLRVSYDRVSRSYERYAAKHAATSGA